MTDHFYFKEFCKPLIYGTFLQNNNAIQLVVLEEKIFNSFFLLWLPWQPEFFMEHNYLKEFFLLSQKKSVGWLYWGLTPLPQLRSYHGGQSHTCVAWLSHASTNTNSFPKPPTTFLTCLSRGERQKYARRKFRLNQVSKT